VSGFDAAELAVITEAVRLGPAGGGWQMLEDRFGQDRARLTLAAGLAHRQTLEAERAAGVRTTEVHP
jgi:hypothetical protein